jgi:hypothetical protein
MNNQRKEPYPLVYEIVNEDAKKSGKKYDCGFIIAIKTSNRTKITATEEWIVALTAIVAGVVVVNKVYSSIKNAVTSSNSYSGSSGSGSSSSSSGSSASSSNSNNQENIDPEKIVAPDVITEKTEGKGTGCVGHFITFKDYVTGYLFYNEKTGQFGIRMAAGGCADYYYKTKTDALNALYVYKKYGKVRKTGRK